MANLTVHLSIQSFVPSCLYSFLHFFAPLFLQFFNKFYCSFVVDFVFHSFFPCFVFNLSSMHLTFSPLFFPPFFNPCFINHYLSHFLSVPSFFPPSRLHSLFPFVISAFVPSFHICSDSYPVVINGSDWIVSKRKWSGSNGVRRKLWDPSHVSPHVIGSYGTLPMSALMSTLASNLLPLPPFPPQYP